MKSPMLPKDHQAAVQRALELGRSGDPAALPELIDLLRAPSNEVQRLAASAIGKLAELDVYIEYWGLNTPQYKMSMYKKQMLYQQEGKRLISVYPRDLPRLGPLLIAKLKLFGYTIENEKGRDFRCVCPAFSPAAQQ